MVRAAALSAFLWMLWLSTALGQPPSNLIVNGSFENGKDPGAWRALAPGASDIEGWTVVAPVDYIGSYFPASEGRRSIDLDGTPGPGAIEQTVATVPGRTYMLEFDLAGNPEGPPLRKVIEVSAGPVDQQFLFDASKSTKTSLGWERRSLQFTAAQSRTTVRFTSLSRQGNWNGAMLDNVALYELPARGARPAPRHAGGSADLSGVWSGTYPGGPLRVRIEQHGAQAAATFIDGNEYVPAGKVSWKGTVTGRTFSVQQVCAHPGYTMVNWFPATITVVNDHLLELHMEYCLERLIVFRKTL